jgi:hypothetical protein
MILVRDVFQLKFGKAKDAKALAKEMMAIQRKLGYDPPRLLTDLTGPYYTFVMELTFQNLTEFEKALKEIMASPEFGQWYQKMIPLVDSGRREIFSIVE